MEGSTSQSNRIARLRSAWEIPTLIVITILIRIPFLKAFDLVAFDGTFYIRQARSLFTHYIPFGGYPVGYPFFIACLLPMIKDEVRAAQAVSFLFSLGCVLILYSLGKRYLKKEKAFFCAAVVSATPLFIRYSLNSMSEATFIFWIMAGLYLYSSRRYTWSGAFLGIAGITRPEALATFGSLAFLRLRKPQQLIAISMGFLVIFSANMALHYKATGHLKLLPKRHLIGQAASDWTNLEFSIEEAKRPAGEEDQKESKSRLGFVGYYFRRLFAETGHVTRQLLPLLLLLALFGIFKKPLFLAAALVQFFLFPFFNIRSAPRYILPYVPIVTLYAFIGLQSIKNERARYIGYLLVFASALLNPLVNQDQLLEPISQGLGELKQAGIEMRSRIMKGDVIADRKPFLPFYAGSEYQNIPSTSYEETIEYLMDKDVRFLSLHEKTVNVFRRSLLPLLYDPAVINGELRYKQTYFHKGSDYSSVLIYERVSGARSLEWKRLTFPGTGEDSSPCWSPDGQMIAFQSSRTGNGDIYIVSSNGGDEKPLFTSPDVEDSPAWSPDGRRIAYASNRSGNFDIYIFDMGQKQVEPVTDYQGSDLSPCWSRDGKAVYFSSDRTGRMEIWMKDLFSGKLTQISNGRDNRFPSVSSGGGFLSWIQDGNALVIEQMGTQTVIHPAAPRMLHFSPSWDPSDNFVAVTGADWGSADVYIVDPERKSFLLLTKNEGLDGQPSWNPKRNALAVVSDKEGSNSIWVVSGLKPYLDRLRYPVKFVTLEKTSTDPK